MRTGGGINPPRSNVVPHTGLFPRTGMMPFFIPVVIPIGMSRTRNYNQRNGNYIFLIIIFIFFNTLYNKYLLILHFKRRTSMLCL